MKALISVLIFCGAVLTQSSSPVAPQIDIGIPINKKFIDFNKVKQITKSVYGISYGGPQIDPSFVSKFFLDDNGYIISIRCSEDTNALISFEYDNKYNITVAASFVSNHCFDADFLQRLGYAVKGRCEYAYDKNGKIIYTELFDLHGEMIRKSKFEYSGDDVIEKVYVGRVLESSRETIHNALGLVSEVKLCDAGGDCKSEKYTYELKNDMISAKSKILPYELISGNEEWTEAYEYDKNGRLTNITMFDWNYDQQYRIEYIYGTSSEIVSVRKYGPLDQLNEYIKYVYE